MPEPDSTESTTREPGHRKGRERVASYDEADEWAEREHKRRRAWLAGPMEQEKREWARREHRRIEVEHMFSRAVAPGPTDEEVEEWAELEQKRRQAWLEGPTEQEKHDWARREDMRLQAKEPFGPSVLGPTDEEIEDWAERERKRRQAWADGPTERERDDRERRAYRRGPGYPYPDGTFSSWPVRENVEETAANFWRHTELASKGAFLWAMDFPFYFWDRLVDGGRDLEERSYGPRRPRRVTYND